MKANGVHKDEIFPLKKLKEQYITDENILMLSNLNLKSPGPNGICPAMPQEELAIATPTGCEKHFHILNCFSFRLHSSSMRKVRVAFILNQEGMTTPHQKVADLSVWHRLC